MSAVAIKDERELRRVGALLPGPRQRPVRLVNGRQQRLRRGGGRREVRGVNVHRQSERSIAGAAAGWQLTVQAQGAEEVGEGLRGAEVEARLDLEDGAGERRVQRRRTRLARAQQFNSVRKNQRVVSRVRHAGLPFLTTCGTGMSRAPAMEKTPPG